MGARQNWFINISDVQSGGFITGRLDNKTALPPRFMRDAWEPRTIYLMEDASSDGSLFDDIDLTNFERLEVGIGPVDSAPNGGTFTLTVDGDGTGLVDLAYNIAADDLKTALNANPAVSGKGGVEVTKTNSNFFRVVLNDANKSLTIAADSTELQPPSTVDVQNPVEASASVRAVYHIKLLQRAYAYSDDWTVATPTATVGTFTADSSTDVLTFSADHGRSAGDRVRLSSSGTLPPPLVAGKDYYILASGLTNDDLKLSEWIDGDAVNITGAGSGTHTMTRRDYGVTLTTLSDGSEGGPASYKVEISPAPLSGAARFSIDQKQKHTIACTANTAVKAVWMFSATSSLISDTYVDGYYFDVRGSANEIVRVWFHNTVTGTSTAPSVPTGGRTLQADYAAEGDMDRGILQSAAFEALNADTDFVADMYGGMLRVTAAVAGVKSPVGVGTSPFQLQTDHAFYNTGQAGRLEGFGFVINDRFGDVCVHVPKADGSLGNLATATEGRLIPVTLTGGETATQVATAFAAALVADGEFDNSTSDGSTLYAVDIYAGPRGATTTASSGYFSVTIQEAGFSFFTTFRSDATADDVSSVVGDQFTVTKPTDFQWIFTRTESGPTTAPQVEDVGLVFATGIEGAISFATDSLHQAFAATTSATITATLEIKLKLTGEEPRVVLHTDCILERDLLSAESMRSPSFDAALTESNGIKFTSLLGLTGGSGYLDGIQTAGVGVGRALAFVYSGQLAVFELTSGTDAEASPEIIRPDDYNASTNAKVWLRRL